MKTVKKLQVSKLSLKKKKKRISTNSTGYKMLGEALDDSDIRIIKKFPYSVH